MDVVTADKWIRKHRSHRGISEQMDKDLEKLFYPDTMNSAQTRDKENNKEQQNDDEDEEDAEESSVVEDNPDLHIQQYLRDEF
jgi:hypothetical protein